MPEITFKNLTVNDNYHYCTACQYGPCIVGVFSVKVNPDNVNASYTVKDTSKELVNLPANCPKR